MKPAAECAWTKIVASAMYSDSYITWTGYVYCHHSFSLSLSQLDSIIKYTILDVVSETFDGENPEAWGEEEGAALALEMVLTRLANVGIFSMRASRGIYERYDIDVQF